MTKEEFLTRLKENNKTFKSVEELIDYQLPVLQYYITNHVNPIYNNDMTKIVVDLDKLILIASDTKSNLYHMNIAFEGLTKRIGEFE